MRVTQTVGLPLALKGIEMDCRTALLTLLDSMDYTVGNCRPNEMVGAVVPAEMIRMCRQAAQQKDAADLPCGYPGCDDIGWNGGFCRLHNPANTANR